MLLYVHMDGIGEVTDQMTGTVEQVDGLSVQEAAQHFGVSEKTIRRRIHSGELAAYKLPVSQGYEWRICLDGQVDTDAAQVDAPSSVQLNDKAAHVDGTVAQLDTPPDQLAEGRGGIDPALINIVLQPLREELEEARREQRRLHDENLELAGRVGFYQAKMQEYQSRILLLEAPKVVEVVEETVEETITEVTVKPVEELRRPWWRRVFGG